MRMTLATLLGLSLLSACSPDMTPPAPVSRVTTAGAATLSWTNPGDEDYAGVLVLRANASAPDTAPTNGSEYAVGDIIGSATVAYVGTAESYTETEFGEFCFAIYSFDSAFNYAGALDNGGCATFSRVDEEVQIARASDGQVDDFFGGSVSISGDRAIVGAFAEDGGAGDPASNSGAAYVFERGGAGVWSEVAILRASDSQADDQFGVSVSISGDWAIVGATGEDGGAGNPRALSGAAYVFERNGAGVWSEVAILRASDSQAVDQFGVSVSISGDRAIVGAIWEDGGSGDPAINSGSAYVFERDGLGTWNEVQILRASDAQANDWFGYSVSISGDRAIVGAREEDGGAGDPRVLSGAAYVFERHGAGVWSEVASLRASDSQAEDRFGTSVSISGNRAIVGAWYEDGGAGDPRVLSGAAYVFERHGAGVWSEVQILRASDSQVGDQFGWSVSISGDRAIVGAFTEDGGAGDPLFRSGAAYVFERHGAGVWSEEVILRASDSQAEDRFGSSVSISGDRAIVGAVFEDGGAGDPTADAGAAYFFE